MTFSENSSIRIPFIDLPQNIPKLPLLLENVAPYFLVAIYYFSEKNHKYFSNFLVRLA